MSEKITQNFFLMGLLAALLSMLLTGMVFNQVHQQQVQSNLITQGQLAAALYSSTSDISALTQIEDEQFRLTLIDTDGTVLFDSQADSAEMDPQTNRTEVQLALTEGSGLATRQSESLGTTLYYYATLLEDGRILRVGVEVTGLLRIFGQCAITLLPLILLLALLAVASATLLTRRLLRPIIALPAELDDPALAEDTTRIYPELAPFILEVQAQRHARETMRQEFTANVTHELKTPLTSISGYAEMISTGIARPDDIPRFAEKICIESHRMQSLVNDIIELSQLDQEKTLLATEPVDLLAVADECRDQLSGSAQQRGVRLHVRGDAFTVTGDEKKLWELVYNLVDNAIRYNRRGGWVEVRVNPAERSIAVADNGIGISEEHQSRVFERFYRVDKSHSRATGGTGLGLSIVKHIAEQHGAKLTLKSTLNVGTEIKVTFGGAESHRQTVSKG